MIDEAYRIFCGDAKNFLSKYDIKCNDGEEYKKIVSYKTKVILGKLS